MECKESDAASAAAASDKLSAAAASASSSSAAAASSVAAAASSPAAAASSSPATAAAATSPSSVPIVSPSEVSLLVDHYLATHYPKVAPLFRLEAKDTLGSVKAAANPRSLHSILNEYVQLKSKADRERALTRALCNQADPTGAAVAASSESCALTRTMAALTTLLSDYSAHKHAAGLPSHKRGFNSTQTTSQLSASTAMQDTVATAPGASKESTAPASAAAAAAAPEPSPTKRRRKARPIRNILPTPVAADEPTNTHPAFAMAPLLPTLSDLSAFPAPAAAAASASDAGPLSPPFLRPQSPFQLPDHLPVQKLGSDGYVTMSVDPEGFESLFVPHAAWMQQQQQQQGAAANGRTASNNDEFGGASGGGSSFADTLAAFINERQNTLNQPLQTPSAAASPRPFLSPSAVDAIAEQMLTDPASREAMDHSFVVEVVPASTTPIKQGSSGSVRGASQSRAIAAAASASPPPRASRSNSAARSPSKPRPTGVAAPLPSPPPPAAAAAAPSSSIAVVASADTASLLSLLHTVPVDTILSTRRAASNSKRT